MQKLIEAGSVLRARRTRGSQADMPAHPYVGVEHGRLALQRRYAERDKLRADLEAFAQRPRDLERRRAAVARQRAAVHAPEQTGVVELARVIVSTDTSARRSGRRAGRGFQLCAQLSESDRESLPADPPLGVFSITRPLKRAVLQAIRHNMHYRAWIMEAAGAP